MEVAVTIYFKTGAEHRLVKTVWFHETKHELHYVDEHDNHVYTARLKDIAAIKPS